MRIGELSMMTGVSERSLRYYEQHGLLQPSRRPSGYRDYRDHDVADVRRIRTLLSAGLGTAVIAEILPCMIEDSRRALVAGCPELLDVLRSERDRIGAEIAELQSARGTLDAIITAPVPTKAKAIACEAETAAV